jgi:hypothetical protein
MKYNAPELRPGILYLKGHPLPTPKILAAERTAQAAWKMYNEAVNDKEYGTGPNCPTLDEITALGKEAERCDQTCRDMWQELYKENGNA